MSNPQQHSEDGLKQIEKDLASSFEYWGSTQPQEFFGRTNAASMIAAQQFIERLCAYFDRQNRDREQRLIKENTEQWFQFMIDEVGYEKAKQYKDISELKDLQEPKK